MESLLFNLLDEFLFRSCTDDMIMCKEVCLFPFLRFVDIVVIVYRCCCPKTQSWPSISNFTFAHFFVFDDRHCCNPLLTSCCPVHYFPQVKITKFDRENFKISVIGLVRMAAFFLLVLKPPFTPSPFPLIPPFFLSFFPLFFLPGRKGEPFNMKKHEQGTEVKAITYSNMQIHQDQPTHDIYVILDI